MGTGIFVPSEHPIRGVVSLSPEGGRYPDLLEFNVRLSPFDDTLVQALIDLELQCLNSSWPSC
jgi:hypothetical protein